MRVELCGAVVSCVVLAMVGVRAEAQFVEESQFGTRTSISVAWSDVDRDGDLDVTIGNSQGGNQLFVNNGDGTYTESSPFGGGATFAVASADVNNDGDLDLAVGTTGYNFLYVNNGDGTFSRLLAFGSSRTVGVAWADFDNDGDLDLAVGNGILGVPVQNQLFVNNGDGSFSERQEFGEGQTATVAWGDFDNDGDPDLAVGNGGFGYEGQNALYVNNGDGSFTEREEFGLGDTASVDWGDFDNDGDLDLAVGNWNGGQSYLYLNNGDGSFTAEEQFGAQDINTVAWGDADNDGDLDLAVGTGDFSSAGQNQLYVNNGDGTFTEQPEFGLGSTDGVAWGDADNDGDLDLAVANEHSSVQNRLYVNQVDSPGFLVLSLVGRFYELGDGYSNRDGIGAKVAVYEAGHMGEAERLLGYREVAAHGGFSSQSALEVHFGLPAWDTVDLRVEWPGSHGRHLVQELPGLAVGQRLTVEEAGHFAFGRRVPLGRLVPLAP